MPAWTPQTRRVSLRQLCPAARFFGADDIIVESVAADSREVQPGDLFAAVSGTRTDGHLHVPEALERGATAILAERYVPAGNTPVCVVPNSSVALARLCHALMDEPTRRLKVIGVTGTNGKTTTTWLIRGILEAAGIRTGLLGTLEYSDGDWAAPSPYTTPPAPVLAAWLARMEATGCTHAVMEVSSHALAQGRIEGVQLHAACITNVRRDHLDFHNSLDNYRAAKAGIFKHLSADGFAVLNTDDPVDGWSRRGGSPGATHRRPERLAECVGHARRAVPQRADVLAFGRQRNFAGPHLHDRRSSCFQLPRGCRSRTSARHRADRRCARPGAGRASGWTDGADRVRPVVRRVC